MIWGTHSPSKRIQAPSQIVKFLKLYTLFASRKWFQASTTQSQSLAFQNQPFVKCESFKHQTFAIRLLQHQSMQFLIVVICSLINAIASALFTHQVVMLSRNSFEKYNERKSPVEKVWGVFPCAFVWSFIIHTANHLETVKESEFFAVIFMISLFVQISHS